MDVDPSPEQWLASASEANVSPAVNQLVSQIEKAWNRKLWHNLTVLLLSFVRTPETGPLQVSLFNNFIRGFEKKLNVLRLVEIARYVSRHIEDPTASLEFLTSLHSRIPHPNPPPSSTGEPTPPPAAPAAEAYALSLASIAYGKLLLGDLKGTKEAMDQSEKILDALPTVDGVVWAGFYGVAGDYYKASSSVSNQTQQSVNAEYGLYYKHSLLYLACVNLSDLSPEELTARAHDLGIAALLGDSIYNFGELLQHPILAALDNTEHSWIKTLLVAFNGGEIGKFESLVSQLQTEAILQENTAFLRQKICLMALIESVFRRSVDDRVFSFQSIAEETKVPVREVEYLVMKALSLKLIRGSLDAIAQTATITWVQPRVLDRGQLEALSARFNDWCAKVGNVGQYVSERGVGITARG
ncbi:26S proteasome regulatory complex, subunit RPN9/PSMD13 [Phaffia rhodozyma]|uniref:26S proteasome regulatory complex, subunit RPN9/PSMD13 n=1 Tax=Phaffia rhodozyma TaxID=264483 RepID=A0A0F7SXN3_PHARH|nr:26S proteasome regulatory complex, subunit RPN9/PSMD13 [Phaffia rhodozyma]